MISVAPANRARYPLTINTNRRIDLVADVWIFDRAFAKSKTLMSLLQPKLCCRAVYYCSDPAYALLAGRMVAALYATLDRTKRKVALRRGAPRTVRPSGTRQRRRRMPLAESFRQIRPGQNRSTGSCRTSRRQLTQELGWPLFDSAAACD